MQAQLIGKDGSVTTLDDEQYRRVLAALGLESPMPESGLSPQAADALLDELEGISAGWGFSTADLLEERRQERDLERRRER